MWDSNKLNIYSEDLLIVMTVMTNRMCFFSSTRYALYDFTTRSSPVRPADGACCTVPCSAFAGGSAGRAGGEQACHPDLGRLRAGQVAGAASCSDDFVPNKMQPDEARNGTFVEMTVDGIPHGGVQRDRIFCLREYRLPDDARREASFRRFFDDKNDLVHQWWPLASVEMLARDAKRRRGPIRKGRRRASLASKSSSTRMRRPANSHPVALRAMPSLCSDRASAWLCSEGAMPSVTDSVWRRRR